VVAARRRLGVALLLDSPVADEVNGIRRAVGDPSLVRVPPHVTVVPPVNVRGDQLHAALARVRSAAAAQPGPLCLTLGPPATFLPVNPVLYLEVGGDLNELRTLRDAVFVAPLARELSWPWVPHVTLADSAEPDRIEAAVAALDHFAAVASVAYLVLLEEVHGRGWLPLADAALGPAAVVGTGGLAMEITRGRIVDPEGWHMLESSGVADGENWGGNSQEREPTSFPIVLTARREDEVVGAALAWRADDGGHVAVVVASATRSQGIGGTLLSHVEAAIRNAGWQCAQLHAHGPPAFYRARSAWSVAPG
jgi:2'-5' RNA ligase